MASFKGFALTKTMLEMIENLGFKTPSMVQELVIPHFLKGESLVVTSETGSGKTHAFLIPLIQLIALELNQTQAIIISPTRELAKQTYDFAMEFKKYYPNLSLQLLTSQVEKTKSKEKLQSLPHLIIATPGRLLDLGINDPTGNLSTVKYLILDEADMLIDSGFIDDIETLLSHLPNAKKFVFSATLNDKLTHLIEKYIQAEEVVKLENYTNRNVKHYAIDIRHQNQQKSLKNFIEFVHPYFLLVFASKKKTVEDLFLYLKEQKYKVIMLHGDLLKRERKNIVKRLKSGEFQIAICSDMVARGLDIEDVSDVLNVDLPSDLSFYFHRAGRTGRFFKEGNCYTFYNIEDLNTIDKLRQLGVNFEYLVLKNDGLKPQRVKTIKKETKKIDSELNRDIQKALRNTKSNQVKPGYKKARKIAIEQVKKKYRREKIRQEILKQRRQQSKEKN